MEASAKEMLIAHGVDWDEGIDRFGGNEAMYEKFIRRFTEDGHLVDLRQALADEDVEQAYYHAHSLKGVVGNLSFGRYFKEIGTVSELLREKKLDEAKSTLPAVEEAHAAVIEALEAL